VAHRPVQYVLQEADFCGLRLYVDENVLIPRPETEELVAWILEDQPKKRVTGSPLTRLFDIGTGSGAIPIALKNKNPSFQITACDVSEPALQVARRNAHAHNAPINFIEVDILNPGHWPQLPVYDIIVSNPPYIPEADKKSMSENVLRHEPHLALFTPGDNAFVFYQAIAAFGKSHLASEGKLFFEIHYEGAEPVTTILKNAGYRDIEVKNDLFGNPRMIKAANTSA
jgi:release factor glutamine methyltransferase